ncbi:hypothetical protein A2872_04015 [Candidatus Gottesmanbacteria bacterium RIFCSPHIGHO2_01_FULL_42_12]|uniref:TVP38/TMEM64 family membrane protein n=1 Tax=Candidatus Gottesmanbacteria bacterium RIFCSPHIGHO2_01_FULL_42_12 TaxID=1798377 RepID=A0A1F5Z411_9BACT|nr:MAG: hypothetical protein A2872_04015 [Candidatus Gottesmanbacteria bacterium RIFCSPHIGHO2_01_FULL_42_12]
MHHRHHLKEFLILAIIILILIISARFGNSIGFSGVIGFLKENTILGALIYVVYATLSVVIITLPIVPLWPVSLFIYPFWIAFILSLFGQVLGSSINFMLARKFGGPFVSKMMGRKLFSEIEHFIHIDNPRTFFLIRLLGSNYFDPISYIAGLSKMPYKTFFVITTLTSSLWLGGMLYLINRLGGLENMKGLLSIMGIYGGFILVGTIIWEIFHRHHKKHFKTR